MNGNKEPKTDYLKRLMTKGSQNARILKLADRLSNINSLVATRNKAFINKYILETREYIMPFAFSIDAKIASELEETLNKLEIRV